MKRDGFALTIAAALLLVIGAGLPTLLFGPLHLGDDNAARLQATLTYAGVMVTAAVTLVGFAVRWLTNKRLMAEKAEQLKQLKLDAAMRAGKLFTPAASGQAVPAAMASGLLALTSLQHAELAVTLLVDLWSGISEDGSVDKVSTETAILVIDAALRSDSPNAQLIAAELLCRNASRLEPGQSLHWPSSLEGCWNPSFSQRAKLLIVEAIVRMSLTCQATETALRSAAVRLYGIWRYDQDENVKGCIGKLIGALLPGLEKLGYGDFMQGNQVVMFSQLQVAANTPPTNPDHYLDQLSTQFAQRLKDWAADPVGPNNDAGCLAAGEHSAILTLPAQHTPAGIATTPARTRKRTSFKRPEGKLLQG
jgi:hypothetical protein